MYRFTIRMAQANGKKPSKVEPDLEDYTVKTPEEKRQQEINNQIPAPEMSPDEQAGALAKEFHSGMVKIGPEFYIEDRTAKLLTALKVLGLNIDSKATLLKIASLFEDEHVLSGDISWFNDNEWMMLISWIQDLPGPSVAKSGMLLFSMSNMHKYAQSNVTVTQMLELLGALQELHFEVDMASPKTAELLKMLAASGASPYKAVAASIVSLSKEDLTDLYEAFQGDRANHLEEHSPKPHTTTTVYKPTTMRMRDEFDRDVEHTEELPYLETDNPKAWQNGKNVAPKTPPTSPPAQAPAQIKPVQPEAPVQSQPSVVQPPSIPKPTEKPVPQGAMAKSKAITEFANTYEDKLQGMPQGVKTVLYGDSIDGVLVLLPTRPGQHSHETDQTFGEKLKAEKPQARIKGGDFVRAYVGMVDGMVMGSTADGKVAVRTFPEGDAEIWDIKAREVRKSQLVPKRTK